MLNVAIVGFGFMGMTHAGNLIKNPNVWLKAVVDKNTDDILKKLELQSGNFSADKINSEDLLKVKTYSDFTECLQKEKPEVCVIAVHTDLHYSMAKMALEAGAHVFLEKPFCLDVDEGKQLIELARKVNRILMIGHVVRFMPAWQLLKKWVDSKEFGDLNFLSLSRFSGIPSWGQWINKQENFGATGGALFDLVIHDVDFAQWVCGVPGKIEANFLPGKLSNYDYVTALWKYNDANLHVKIEGGNNFHSQFPFHASFAARFQDVSISYSSNSPENVIMATDSGIKSVAVGNPGEGFSDELNYFIDCIINHEQPVLCSPESALEAVKICYRHIN